MNTDQVEPVLSEVVRAIELGGGPAKVARALRVSTQTVCFYRDGKRRFNSDHGATLEALTDRQVTRKHIWPVSWPRIWPELASVDAPDSSQSPERAEAGATGS